MAKKPIILVLGQLCFRGHLLDEQTLHETKPGPYQQRYCRKCKAVLRAKYKAKDMADDAEFKRLLRLPSDL